MRLQKLSLTGLCVCVNELDALVSRAPALTSLALPPTATSAWMPKLAPLPHLQELTVEYVAAALALRGVWGAAGVPAAAGAGMHAPRPMLMSEWACHGQLRALEIRRRSAFCRGDVYAVMAPQLSTLSGLTRLVWAAPLVARSWCGDWAAVLADSLKTLTYLRHLEMSVGRDSGADGATRFADAVGRLTSLTHLSLTVHALTGLAAALRCTPLLRLLSVKVHVPTEHGIGACSLLCALPCLSALTRLRLVEKRPWSRCTLRACRQKSAATTTLAAAPVHTTARSVCEHADSRPYHAAGGPHGKGDRAVAPAARRSQQARGRMLRGVARHFEALAAARQLQALQLDVPYMGEVIDALAPQLAQLHSLQRLELAALGGRYNSTNRVLWPHLMGMPLQEGVRLW